MWSTLTGGRAAMASFRVFCETYFPEVFYLAWSEDHLRVIGKVERAVREGNLAAIAMPRGSGKTVMLLGRVLLGRSDRIGQVHRDRGGQRRTVEGAA